MSSKKNLKSLAPCFGEAYVENFYFSSLLSNSFNNDDTMSVKLDKEYVHWEFIEDDLIKSKFWATKSSTDRSLTPSTNGEQVSSRSKKIWGWSSVKYDADENESTTPYAK